LSLSRRAAIATLLAVPLAACHDAQPEKPKIKDRSKPKPELAGSLVELVTLDPTIRLDIRYATKNNFTGRMLYDQPRAFLIKPAAQALVRAHWAARRQGFGLTIFDAYRPWRVTKALWDATAPGPKKNYVANPKKGSKHNRGCAVDLTLHRLATDEEVAMPSGYDEFTPRADRNYSNAPAEALANRNLLERLMEAHGFRGASNEWWHFDFRGWQDHPILNIDFADLG
jgi:zinc D-Ala-D-Ala dipeptidase